MNSLERTLNFIKHQPVDRPPFHPIIMRFAAKYAGVKYRDFCLNYRDKCYSMITCAEDFSLDWVTVMSDPYAEAEAFGLEVEYPENDLPKAKGLLLKDICDVNKLTMPRIEDSRRLMNRIHEIEEFKRQIGDQYFIVGWVEGPMAEFADIRGLAEACMDLHDYPDKIRLAAGMIVENALQFITAQVKAGAHCIGIGDAACSIIGPQFYREFFFEGEKRLIKHIHSLGALAKLHICGNTTAILPDMIKTGADIIDVDHLVTSMEPFTSLLSDTQVLCGNSNPVSVIQNGDKEVIFESVRNCFKQTRGRGIVSAGCEITPDTSLENFNFYRDAALSLSHLNNTNFLE
jgi:MtaA/CmuA family methyltransferase